LQLREINEKGLPIPVAEPNFNDVREGNRSLDSIAQYAGSNLTVTGANEAVRTRVVRVSGDFFKVLGVSPAIGRAFLPEETQPGTRAVAIVSYGFWQQMLGGNQNLSEKVLKINDLSYEVVGVMPAGLGFPREAEIWIPRALFPAQTSRTAHNWSAIARLADGVNLEQARADVSTIGKQLKQQYGSEIDATDFALIPIHEFMTSNVRQSLLIILAAVGLLLLVACANVTNLLLAQITGRQREFAVRAALGATRFKLARQFITENVMLALIAGALGSLLAIWGVDFLMSLGQRNLPRADEIGVDMRALAFTLMLSLAIAVALGVLASLRFSLNDLQTGLKESSRGQSAYGAGTRLRSTLVSAQVALTMVLLVGAGLLTRSFMKLIEIDPGFRPDSTVVMNLALPSTRDPERQKQIAGEYRELVERISHLPGVTVAGGINSLPMSGTGSNGAFFINNDRSNSGYADYRQATAGYFAAVGIPLLRGRLFEESDGPDSPHVAVISQALAEKTWPGEDPIGRQIQFGNMDGDLRLLHIVGIVGDVRELGLDQGVGQTIYAYSLQRPISTNLSIVARAESDSATLISAMRQTVQSLNPELPVNFSTLEKVFSSSLDTRRFSLVIFTTFAIVALVLAVTGIYGVMSYTVAQRTQEIGIRLALGAHTGAVLKMVIFQGMKLSFAGVVLGLAASFAASRLLESFLFGVATIDTVTFATIPVILVLASLLACYIPARRATKVDPIIALRYE
jgi:predicted permease